MTNENVVEEMSIEELDKMKSVSGKELRCDIKTHLENVNVAQKINKIMCDMELDNEDKSLKIKVRTQLRSLKKLDLVGLKNNFWFNIKFNVEEEGEEDEE